MVFKMRVAQVLCDGVPGKVGFCGKGQQLGLRQFGALWHERGAPRIAADVPEMPQGDRYHL